MASDNEIYDFSKLTQRREEPTFTPLPMVMEEAAKTNPAQYAESSRISRLTGLPIETVQADLPRSRAQAKAVEYDFTGLVQRSPVTGEFLKSYKNSVFAQNDVMTLEDIERVYNESASRTSATANVAAVSRAIPGGIFQGIGLGTAGIGTGIEIGGRTIQKVADFLLPEAADRFIWENPADKYLEAVDPAAFLRARGEGTQQLGQMIRGTEAQSMATDIAGGVGQMLGQAVMHIFAPQLSGAMMLGQGIEQQRERQEVTGTYAQDGMSDLALATGGLATLALEKTGIESMLERIPPNIRNDLARNLADVFIAGGIEGVQEVVESVTQSLIERASTNADAPLLEGAVQEGAVGFGVGAIVRSLILTATPGRVGEAVAQQQEVVQRGQQDLSTLDNLSELIGSTELRQLSQESFHEFVSRLNSDGNTHVYIDSAQLDLYLREQKNKAIPDPALILLSEQADEARALGVAVTIPIQDFATVVAATPHYDALREAMTLSADATPVYRQKQAEFEAENYMTLLVKQAKENVSQYAEAQTIYESIKQQLVDTGRVSQRNASVMAQIVPAWATVYSQQTGKSIAEVYAESGLTVVGPQTGKKQSLAERAVNAVKDVFGMGEPVAQVQPDEYQVPESDTAVLNQARVTGYAGQDAGESRSWLRAVEKFGPEGMTTEARMARAEQMGFDTEQKFYHGTMRVFDGFAGLTFLTSSPDEASAYTGAQQMRNARRVEELRSRYVESSNTVELDGVEKLPYVGIISDIPYSQRDRWWATDEGVVRFVDPDKKQIQIATDYVVDYDQTDFDFENVTISKGDGSNSLKVLLDDVDDVASRLDTDFGQGNVIPVYAPKGKYKEVTAFTANLLGARLQDNLPPDLQNRLDKLLADIEQWKSEGYVGIVTSSDEGVLMGRDVPQKIIFDPSNIRSVNAAFDPDSNESADLLAQSAFHGTPHRFSRFSLSAVGTGEGAQAYGWGLYFAQRKEIAEYYRRNVGHRSVVRNFLDKLPEDADFDEVMELVKAGEFNSSESALLVALKNDDWLGMDYPSQAISAAFGDLVERFDPSQELRDAAANFGALYQVNIPEDSELLDWDKPLTEQSEKVREALSKIGIDSLSGFYQRSGKYNSVLDLIPPSATGKELVEILRTEQRGERDASLYLNSLGIPGLKYLDANSRNPSGRNTSNYVIWDETRVTIEAVNDQKVEAEDYFEELGQKGARGYYEPQNSVIRLTESSDLTTFLHEFGHFMLEMEKKVGGDTWKDIGKWFKRNAADVAAEAEAWLVDTKNDTTTKVTEADVTAFVDNGTTGENMKDRALYVATHEQFARAWEQYLMEGKAPSTELHNIFQTFARWMVEVYEKIKGALRVNLDDEMRQVFDRMIATEAQIKAAEARAKVAPLFTDAAMAGMSEEAYLKYLAKVKKVSDKAAETLRDKLIKQLTRQTEQWWTSERDDIIREVLTDLRATRTYSTIDALRYGTVKLDKAAVKEMVGDLRISKRGVEFSAVPRQLNNMTLDGMQGIHPNEAALMFNYSSGSELLNDIMTAKPIAEVATEAAQKIMLDRHGDILNDGSIQREADEALQNEEQGKLILAELKALNRRVNVDRINLSDMAKRKISELSYREINTQRYRAAELRAAQEAARMLAEGNTQGAADAKMRQLMNHYLARAALEARTAIESIQGDMARYNKKSVQEAIAKAQGGYWQQIEKILIRFEFRKSATMKSVDKLNESIQSWAASKIENDGDALIISDAAGDESYVTHWKNVPFGELQGIADTVKNIEHVARYANKITYLGEQRDFEDVVNMWTESIDTKVKSVWAPKIIQTVQKESTKRMAKWHMSQLTKIPYMMSWLDGGERVGMSHELVSQRMNDALNREFELHKEIATPVIEAIRSRSTADRKRHMREVFIEEIGENMKGHQILAVALNVGNAGNLKKLLLGEGWADPRDPASISLDNPKLQAILKHMTKSDWDLVQKIWDQMELLYPMLEEVHRKSTGLTPPKVVATPVQTPFGEFRGGYYPLKGDPGRSNQVQKNQTKLDAATDSLFSTFGSIHASVFASATQERTGVYYPLDLNLDVVPNHFQEVIHFITHHDAVKQVNKLLNNDKVATSIKKALGPEEFALLRPWLNDVAKDGKQSGIRKGFLDPAFARFRFGVTLGVMGFKATTAIIQLAGLSNAVSEVGLGNMKKAFRMILNSPSDTESAKEFAFNRSKILKHRMTTMDREMRDIMADLQGKRGVIAAMQEVSMKHIAFVQTYIVDIPSWYAGYSKELAISGDEVKAAQYGDWVVEQIQGSGATKDMAALMRDPSKATRLFTMFMTFFSAKWNRDRDAVRGARSGRYSTTSIAAYLMFAYTIPVLFDMLLRGEIGDDEDDEEDNNIQDMLTTTAMYAVGGVPFVRDIANGVIGEYGYSMTPISRIIEGGVYGIPKIIEGTAADEEITKAQWKAATEFIGALAGIPGVSQMWVTGEEAYDVLAEGEDINVLELFLFRGEQ